jgi:hypothetical protein
MTLMIWLAGLAQDDILEKFREFRPTDRELEMYRLDWAPSLPAAKERASKEGRPILVFTISTITGYGDLYSGHC